MNRIILFAFLFSGAAHANSDLEKFISLNLHIMKEGSRLGVVDHVLSACDGSRCAVIKKFSTDLTQLDHAKMEQVVYVSYPIIEPSLRAASISLEKRGVKFQLSSKVRCHDAQGSALVLEDRITNTNSITSCSEERIEITAHLRQREFAGTNVSAEFVSTYKNSKSGVDLAQLKKFRLVFATGMSGRWRVLTHKISEDLEPRDYFDGILNSLNSKEVDAERILPKIFDDDVDNGDLIMDQLLRIENEAVASGDERPILLISNSRACNEILDALLEDKFSLLKNGKIKGWLAIQGSFLGTPRVEAGYDKPEIRLAVDLIFKKALYSLTAIARDAFMTANNERIEQLAKRLPIISIVGRIPNADFNSQRIETYKKLIADGVDNDGSVPSYSETLAGTDYVLITGIDHEGFSAQNNYGFDRQGSFNALMKMLLKRVEKKY